MDRQGNVLHSWHMMTPEEETLVLRQFLRFGETRAIAQQLLHHDAVSPRPDHGPPTLRDLRDLRDPIRDTLRDREPHRDIREIHHESRRDLHRNL
ncbi:hypothetical protein Pcinc_014687 [Petrolisthes cinctipes]|uniref:Uncharacterized protein n=1 Tax=Petrolisthes cinctipes TaxID=88211 RepID=A0AAE1FUK0_PETCI|nr:hypothetical protein Pcinc_014687 [Petrolisthes cinctipes]